MTDLFENKSKSHVEPGDKPGEAQDLDQQRDKYCVLFGVELAQPKHKSHRAVFGSIDGNLHVGLYTPGDADAEFELSFDPQKAVDLAAAVLAGDSQALTMPGAMRMISACLLDAAYREAERVGKQESARVNAQANDKKESDGVVGDGVVGDG